MRSDGIGVAREKIFAFTDAYDQWRTAPRADNDIGIIRADHADSVSPDDFAQGFGDSQCQRMHRARVFAFEFCEMLADEMGQDFGVRGGLESMAGFEQAVFDPVVVFNDAVMHQGEAAGLIQMRMGIFVGRRAVGCPAGVADAQGAEDGRGLEELGEALVDLALFFADFQAVLVDDGQMPALS